MLDFFDRIVWYFQKFFFLYMERSKNHEKIYHRAKKFTFLRRFDHKNTVSGILRNLIDKLVFVPDK